MVYIQHTTQTEAACAVIHAIDARLQRQHLNDFLSICLDFYHVFFIFYTSNFSTVCQMSTSEEKTQDLPYAKVRNANHSTAIPPLSISDYNLALLTLSYTPAVYQHLPLKRTVKKWTPDEEETLLSFLETTEWCLICDPHGEDVNRMLNSATAYVHFCTENITAIREVHCSPNNKPWITSELKALLTKKKRTFWASDKDDMSRVQRELKV